MIYIVFIYNLTRDLLIYSTAFKNIYQHNYFRGIIHLLVRDVGRFFNSSLYASFLNLVIYSTEALSTAKDLHNFVTNVTGPHSITDNKLY